MFCPEGYLIINDLAQLTPLAIDFVKEVNQSQQNRFRGISVQDIIENKQFSLLLELSSVHLSSPTGQVVRFASEEIFDKIDFPDELEAVLEPQMEVQLGIQRAHISHEIAVEVYGSDSSESVPRPAMPLFFQRPYYTVTLNNYRTLRELAKKYWKTDDVSEALALSFENDPFWQIIEKFEGWSMCVPKADFAEILTRGPMMKPPFESEAELVRKIIHGFDDKSFRTKSEAFGLFSGSASHRKFGMAWARAADQRPELSSPGRKSSIKN